MLNGVAAIASDRRVGGRIRRRPGGVARARARPALGRDGVGGRRDRGARPAAARPRCVDIEGSHPTDLWAVGYHHFQPLILRFDGDGVEPEPDRGPRRRRTRSRPFATERGLGRRRRRSSGSTATTWTEAAIVRPACRARRRRRDRRPRTSGPWARGPRGSRGPLVRRVYRYAGRRWVPVEGPGVAGSERAHGGRRARRRDRARRRVQGRRARTPDARDPRHELPAPSDRARTARPQARPRGHPPHARGSRAAGSRPSVHRTGADPARARVRGARRAAARELRRARSRRCSTTASTRSTTRRTTAGRGSTLFQQVLVEEQWGRATGRPVGHPVAAVDPARRRHRGAEGAVPPPGVPRRATRRVRDHRGARRLGPDDGPTTARSRDGDAWVIDGEKWHVTSGDVADFFLVHAHVDGDPAKATVFLVDKDLPGVELVRTPKYSHTFVFEHPIFAFRRRAASGDDAVLGEVGGGFELTKDWFVEERIMIGARTIGAATRALDLLARVREGARAVRPADRRRSRRSSSCSRTWPPRSWRRSRCSTASRWQAARGGADAQGAPRARVGGQARVLGDGGPGGRQGGADPRRAAATCASSRSSGCGASSASTGSGRAPPRSSGSVIGNELRKRGPTSTRAGRPDRYCRVKVAGHGGSAGLSSVASPVEGGPMGDITIGIDLGGTKIQAAAVRDQAIIGTSGSRPRRAVSVTSPPRSWRRATPRSPRPRRIGRTSGASGSGRPARSTGRQGRSRARPTSRGSRPPNPSRLARWSPRGWSAHRSGSTTTCASRSSASGSAAPAGASATSSACGSGPAWAAGSS